MNQFEAEGCPWYALRVESGHELTAAMLIQSRPGIQRVYLPVYHELRRKAPSPSRKHGQVVEVERPLFSGYLFAQFPWDKRWSAVGTPYVIDVLEFGGEPAVLSDAEIEYVRTLEASAAEPATWRPGTMVEARLDNGVSVQGVLVSDDGKSFVIIQIEALGRALRVPVARYEVRAA